MKKIVSYVLVVMMLFTSIPNVFAATDFNLVIGDSTSYEIKTGETINVPVYIEPTSAESVEIAVLGFHVSVPEGFTATVTDGILKAKNAEIFVNDGEVVLLKSDTTDFTKTSALCTINYTATSAKAGKYDLKLIGEDGDNMAAQMDEEFNEVALSFDVNAPSITVIEDAGKTITSIDVSPSEITVPYDKQDDIVAYVKENITDVTATYSDTTTAKVDKNDCSITVSENVATVTYEGISATINLKLESKPPVSEKDFNLIIGDSTSYEIKTGETINVPVYIEPTSAESIEIAVLGFHVSVPEGFTVTVTDGILKAKNAEIFVNDGEVVLLKSDTTDFTKTSALCTINYTATSAKAGKYDLKLIGEDGDNMAAQMDEEFNEVALSFDVKAPAITVVDGGSTPTKVLDSITVSPDTVTIPYGDDAEETIKKAITVKALYTNDDTEDNVTGYELEIGDTTATVNYTVDGVTKTADIKLIREAAPVLTVENTKVTVPYGTTADAAFITKAIGAVKLNDTTLTTDKYTVTYNSGDATATVKYNDDDKVAAVMIDVNYVVLTAVEIALKPGVEKVELPWDIETGKESEFIKSCIVVTAKFSDSTTKELDADDYDVMYDAEKGEFYVEFNGQQSTTMTVTKGTKPAAELTEITVNPTEVVVPYGTEDAKLVDVIKNAVTVTAKYDDGTVVSPVSVYSISVDDGKATITLEDKTAEVTLVYETRELVLDKTEITLDEGVTKDDVIKYVKDTVKVSFKYSDKTEEKVLADGEYEVTVNDEMTLITVTADGETQTINLKIMLKPDFISEDKATNAYGITGTKLVIFTNVKDGKVLKITDEKGSYDATYMGNGKWAAVIAGNYTIEVVDGALPEAAKFGHLHDADRVTAYDALLTLLKANNNAVKTFDDNYQMYLLADVDGDGEITADEALYINKISLGIAEESQLWFNK